MGAIEELRALIGEAVTCLRLHGKAGLDACHAKAVAAALEEAELAARGEERVVEVECRDGVREIRMVGMLIGHLVSETGSGVASGRYAMRGPLPDGPKPVAVWERPEHAGAPYMCSACSTPLQEHHLGERCPICHKSLASTRSPWPGTTDQLAAQERAAKGG